jgi:hypothetical protein
MIYKGYTDGKLTSVIAECDCGCGGFDFRLFGDTVFVSYMGSLFYAYQGKFNNIKFLYKKLHRKELCLADSVLTKTDVTELISALKEFKFEKEDNSFYDNVSHIEFEKLKFENDDIEEYELLLLYDGSSLSILRGKVFHGFDISFKEKDFISFIDMLENNL